MIRRRVSWAWWGFVGGVAGLVMILIDPLQRQRFEKPFGPEIVEFLDKGIYHLMAGVGLVAVLCLIMFATGWRRWAGANRKDLPALAVAAAVVVTATLVLLGTGIKGALAAYTVGGVNADDFIDEGVYALFVLDDSVAYFAWWGVQIAAGLVAWLSFKDRLLPAWFGVVTVVVVLPTVVSLVMIGVLDIAGLFGPIWLILASLYLAFRGLPEVERSPQHNTETM